MKMKTKMKKLLIIFTFFLNALHSFAQSDTSFWFAAPEISNHSNLDRPIKLFFTTRNQASTVTVSQPANLSFAPIILAIAANTTQSVDLTAFIDSIETKPGNMIRNFGLKISSSSAITTYYEVNAGGANSEIFALKGSNSLGLDFFVSSQDIALNWPAFSPSAYNSFNIVATENNTNITITPTQSIVGHAANIPFNITLNKGQTYAAIATGQAATDHLGGSRITANKPIAVTLSDDLVGYVLGVTCADLMGDQTVPTSKIGDEYIAVRGDLNFSTDKIFVMATQNATLVYQDGTYVATLQQGQTQLIDLSGTATYITANNPIYVYQMSGSGCEVGGAILPQIDCSGSSSVRVYRNAGNNLSVTLLTRAAGINNFLVNNTAGVILGSQFSAVPGTLNSWYSAKINLSTYPANSNVHISNTSNLFHLGVLDATSNGMSFGYFSDFNVFQANASTNDTVQCVGSTMQLSADTVVGATYSWSGPSGFSSFLQNPTISNIQLSNAGSYTLNVSLPGCSINSDTINIVVNATNAPVIQATNTINYCSSCHFLNPGLSVTGLGNCSPIDTIVIYFANGFAVGQDTLKYNSIPGLAHNFNNATGTLKLFGNFSNNTWQSILQSVCYQSLSNTNSNSTKTIVFNLGATIVSLPNNLASAIAINILQKQDTIITQNICSGSNFLGYSSTGVYIDTFAGSNGCDSTRTINLTVSNSVNQTINQFICQGDSSYGYYVSGTFIDTFILSSGCDSIRTLNLTVNALPMITATPSPNDTICNGSLVSLIGSGGSSYVWSNGVVNNTSFVPAVSGTYTVIGTDINGCSSLSTIAIVLQNGPLLTISTQPSPPVICDGDSINLTALGATSYTWSSGIQNNVHFFPTSSGAYTVTGLSSNGCTATASTNITVYPLPFVNSTPINSNVCIGSSITLSGTGALSYQWSGGISNGISYIPSITSTYTITGTDVNGCTSSNTKLVTVNNLPTITATVSPNDTICSGASIALSGNGGATYAWNGGIVNNVSFVPTSNAIYTVTGTDVNGCSGTSTIEIYLNPAPIISISTQPSSGAVCLGNTVTLVASGALNMMWSNGQVGSAVVMPVINTVYTVVGLNSFSCTTSATVLVSILPQYNSTDTLDLCEGMSMTIFGNLIDSEKVYTLNLTSQNGCDSVVSLYADFHKQPVFENIKPDNGCLGIPIELETSTFNSENKYTWLIPTGNLQSQSQNGAVFTFGTVGIHPVSLTVTPVSPCVPISITDSIRIHRPVADISLAFEGDSLCSDQLVTFTSKFNDQYTFNWEPSSLFDSNTNRIVSAILPTDTTVTLMVTDTIGCSGFDSKQIDLKNCCKVYVPNAFTPNFDDENDFFMPIVESSVNVERFLVYNRWGQIVFEADDTVKAWDGHFKELPMHSDTYFYVVQYKCDGVNQILKGDLLLLR